MLAVALGNLAFGLTTNLYVALLARFALLGACNGYASLTSLVCHDLGGERRQAEVFSYVIAAGSIVAVLGPALGGLTYASLGGVYFPALAPSLIGCTLALLAAAATMAWLPEPHQPRNAKPAVELAVAEAATAAADAAPSTAPPADAALPAAASAETPSAGTAGREDSLWRILRRAPMPLAIVLRAGHGLLVFAVFEVVPLWAIASHAAGGCVACSRSLNLLGFCLRLFTVHAG